jgi:hypothetical protein
METVERDSNLTKILEIIEILRTTPDDEITSRLIIDLEKLAKPKKNYNLSSDCNSVIVQYIEKKFNPKDFPSDFVAKQMERQLKESKSEANKSLRFSIGFGIRDIEFIRGVSLLRKTTPDYSKTFVDISEIIVDDGLFDTLLKAYID